MTRASTDCDRACAIILADDAHIRRRKLMLAEKEAFYWHSMSTCEHRRSILAKSPSRGLLDSEE